MILSWKGGSSSIARRPDEITSKVSDLFESRAARFKRASRLLKIFFVSFFAAVAGVAQFAELPADGTPTTVQTIGMLATVVAFIGSLFVLFTEEDASEELAVARRASEDVRDMVEELQTLPNYEDAIERQAHLYQSAAIMRSALERAAVSGDGLRKTIGNLMELTKRTLPVALGFAQADRWTICIYRAEESPTGRDILKCVANNRAIECDLQKVRSWEEGVGVAGIAYANRQEIVVPNMQAAGLGTVFNIASGERDYDADRYRSITAVPIKVDGRTKPWGVAVATNDRYGHFSFEEDLGPQNVEGVRLLAGMIALTAAVLRENPDDGPGEIDSSRVQ